MTKDLAICAYGWDVKEGKHYQVTDKFMDKIDENFQKKWKLSGH
jgi:isocitrate dehydrogenase